MTAHQHNFTHESDALSAFEQSLVKPLESRAAGTIFDAQAIQNAIDLVRASKFGTFRIPIELGGFGGTFPELTALVIRLASIDPNIPHILRNHFVFTDKILRSSRSPKYERLLNLVRAGRLFGVGVSELGTQNIGNNDNETLLVPDGDAFLLNGVKYYSTGNYYIDFIAVNAVTPEAEKVVVIVPARREGVNVDDDWDGIGQQFTASGTTVFDKVRIEPSEVIIPTVDETPLLHEATFPQLYLTAIIAGILRAVVRDAALLIHSRKRNYYHAVAQRPADDPLLQQIVGRLASAAFVAEAAVLNASEALGRVHDAAIAGHYDPELSEEAALRVAKAKIVVDELALDAATKLFDVGGASAATRSKHLDRHWRNIRTLSSHNPLAYKARVIGLNVIDGTPLPTGAFF